MRPADGKKRSFHFHFDIDSEWERVNKWTPIRDGRLLTSWDWEELRREAKQRGWKAIPTCDNPDDEGYCAGHEEDEVLP